MLRNTFLAVLTVLAVAAAAQAAVTISSTKVATPGLAGFETWTVTATSDGAPLQGFDFVGDPTAPVEPATSRGFFGTLNQITAPVSTVWTDSDAPCRSWSRAPMPSRIRIFSSIRRPC
jgi:hypothetical protein